MGCVSPQAAVPPPEGRLVGGTLPLAAIALGATGFPSGSVRGDGVLLRRQQRVVYPHRARLAGVLGVRGERMSAFTRVSLFHVRSLLRSQPIILRPRTLRGWLGAAFGRTQWNHWLTTLDYQNVAKRQAGRLRWTASPRNQPFQLVASLPVISPLTLRSLLTVAQQPVRVRPVFGRSQLVCTG